MPKTTMLLAVAGLAAMLPLGEAEARDYYGAIAYSTSTQSHGYSNGYDSQVGAEQRAMSECANYGGGCQIAVWFSNACGALAVGPDGWGSDWDTTEHGAGSKAVAKCNEFSYGCKVVRLVCTIH